MTARDVAGDAVIVAAAVVFLAVCAIGLVILLGALAGAAS